MQRTLHIALSILIFLVAATSPAQEELVQVRQDFSKDPGWE
jgi:hypothetical protein